MSAPPLPPYPRDPSDITRLSFARVAAACSNSLSSFPPSLKPLARRIVHASGDPKLLDNLKASPDFATHARAALFSPSPSSPVFCDSRMLACAVAAHAPDAICLTHSPQTLSRAAAAATTRAMAALDLFLDTKPRAPLFLFGSAPTALLRLLEHCLEQGRDSSLLPAAVFAFPVGFVSARESKEALMLCAEHLPIPYITLTGLRGGSALAAAAFNALFEPIEHDEHDESC